MRLRKPLPELENLIEAYVNGESMYSICRRSTANRASLITILKERGIQVRNVSEGQLNRMAKMTPEERRLLNAPGRSSWKGSHHSEQALIRMALRREANQNSISHYERDLAAFLRTCGYDPSQQKAVWKYNIDLTIGNIGIEVLGGAWHNTKDDHTRAEYLLAHGYSLLFIWVQKNKIKLTEKAFEIAADFTKSFTERSGYFQVIRGDGIVLSSGTITSLTEATFKRYGRKSVNFGASSADAL